MQNIQKFDQKEIVELLFSTNQATFPEVLPENAEDVSIEVENEITLACRFFYSDDKAPNILYFPAAVDTPDSFGQRAEMFHKFGMNVFFVTYRGQGKSHGAPAYSSLLQDGVTLVPRVKQFLAGKNCSGSLFVMGRSIGSIVAVETISQKNDDFKGMIIESGICSTPSYVSALGANIEQLGILEEDGFDMLSKVEGITLPTLIFHGATDPFIPVVQAERIQSYSGARSKQFFIIPGGTHDNLAKIGGDLYFQTIKQFTDTICGVNTWRKRRKKQKSPGKE